MILPQVVLVVGQVAAGELHASVGIVEDLDPACPLSVAVRKPVRVLHEDLSDSKIRQVLGTEIQSGEQKDDR